jgi:uncharacterized membrane protein
VSGPLLPVAVVGLHVLAAAVWVGGTLQAGHLVTPAASRGSREALDLLARGRRIAWGAAVLLVLTGLENLRRVGLSSPWLAAKLLGVMVLLALAAQRDFGALPRARRALAAGAAPGPALAGVRALDRAVLLLSVAVLLLGVAVARGY